MSMMMMMNKAYVASEDQQRRSRELVSQHIQIVTNSMQIHRESHNQKGVHQQKWLADPNHFSL